MYSITLHLTGFARENMANIERETKDCNSPVSELRSLFIFGIFLSTNISELRSYYLPRINLCGFAGKRIANMKCGTRNTAQNSATLQLCNSVTFFWNTS